VSRIGCGLRIVGIAMGRRTGSRASAVRFAGRDDYDVDRLGRIERIPEKDRFARGSSSVLIRIEFLAGVVGAIQGIIRVVVSMNLGGMD
jgi:hypothetical protein